MGSLFSVQFGSNKAPLSSPSGFVSEDDFYYHPAVMRQFLHYNHGISGGHRGSNNKASIPLPDREVSVETEWGDRSPNSAEE